jgi:hypothetical protein
MTTEYSNKKTGLFSAQWLSLALIIIFIVLVRLRLLEFPLERDEGEYAYMGQLILQGIPPYMDAYNMKFPGTYAMFALIMSIFGQSIRGVHFGFMIVNCVTVLLVFFLARKCVSRNASLAAAAAYALLSLSPSVLGFAAHATHFVLLPALGGVLALLTAIEKEKRSAFFYSGALFGLAVLMKQPGLFFFLFGATYILYNHFFSSKVLMGEAPPVSFPQSLSPHVGDRGNPSEELEISKKDCGQAAMTTDDRMRISSEHRYSLKTLFLNLGTFITGGMAPLILTLIYLYIAGVFDRFWFWTLEYASKYGSQIPASDAFAVFRANMSAVADGFSSLWIMSALGFIVMLFYSGLKGKKALIALFSFFSFLTICPGFYFRPHYFITLLPAVAILIGVFSEWLNVTSVKLFKTRHLRFLGTAIFILAAGAGIASQWAYLFKEEPMKLSRTVYGVNPFPESPEIAKFIESHSAATDRIAILGSEPQIFFYSKRHSATGYIYTYSLMESHPYALMMQEEMIREVMSANPKFLIFVKIATSWLMRPESEKYIFGWLNGYVRDNYSLVGVADIISAETTVYKWYGDAQEYAVQSPYHVLIFENKRK